MFELPPFDGDDFFGSKIAILRGAEVLSLQRDDIASIPFPGKWDLPGGGREERESPFETVARELFEELSVQIDPSQLIYHAESRSAQFPDKRVHFFVARFENLTDDQITLGDEGQGWAWIPIADFLEREDVILSLRTRLGQALKTLAV